MQFSLEFRPTLFDYVQFLTDRQPRWLLVAGRIVGACLLAVALHHLWTTGLDLGFGILMAAGIMFGVPFYPLSLALLLLIRRPTLRVSADEYGVRIGSKKHKQDIPWSSFATFGAAAEFKHYFWLQCGRGALWIPKRAFASRADLAAFRQFAIEKMGDRCKFDRREHDAEQDSG